ncbi:hypothetical protein HHK36_006871 [Tetracentron sinense]|uniref:Fe2OG dioxygenase domain-containing protein n=1 Tax=Tetracentron sinense TaxID=13715 RepID=A0A834ZQJ1_TETSI|nr:hypothetical protein HHK36_006871 [Tetracentron sinense]
MASNFDSIPLIDVSPLLSNPETINLDDPNVLQVVKKLHEACQNVGFFYVKGHGIPDTLVKGVRDAARNFFLLPHEEKMKIQLSASTGYRGYTKLLDNKTQGKADLHESIDAYTEFAPGTYGPMGEHFEGPNLWPEYPQGFKEMMDDYGNALEKLSKMIMRGVVLALRGSPNLFEGDRAGKSFWSMRLIGCPGSGSAAHPSAMGIGAHRDYGLLILVNQDDDITALEVLNRRDEWIPAVPVPGAFLCNIGDMLNIWSNGMYTATTHRVINSSSKYRVSIPFFYEPNFQAIVEPLEFYKQKTGGVSRFQKVVYAEYLLNKIRNNFVG